MQELISIDNMKGLDHELIRKIQQDIVALLITKNYYNMGTNAPEVIKALEAVAENDRFQLRAKWRTEAK